MDPVTDMILVRMLLELVRLPALQHMQHERMQPFTLWLAQAALFIHVRRSQPD